MKRKAFLLLTLLLSCVSSYSQTRRVPTASPVKKTGLVLRQNMNYLKIRVYK